jgi:hypothetical protein
MCNLNKTDRKKMNKDFETFKSDITWFIKPTDKVEFLDNNLNITLSNKFQETSLFDICNVEPQIKRICNPEFLH